MTSATASMTAARSPEQSNGHAFLTGPNGVGLKDLGTLSNGYTDSQGNGVNASGQVVGTSPTSRTFISGNGTHAFLSGANGAGLKDLGTLPGGGDFSIGYGVNNSGQVTGVSHNGTTDANGFTITHAFLSGANGLVLTDLGTLPGDTNSEGLGINDSGQVVGDSGTTDVNGNPFTQGFLDQGGTMTDLDTLIDPSLDFTITKATSISDTGFITGVGVNSSGQSDAFLLTPNTAASASTVPEPSSLAALSLGAFGLCGMIVKARKKKAV